MCSKRPCSLEKSFQNAKHLNFTTYFHVASRYSGDGSTITGRNISVLSPKLERNSYDTFELFNSKPVCVFKNRNAIRTNADRFEQFERHWFLREFDIFTRWSCTMSCWPFAVPEVVWDAPAVLVQQLICRLTCLITRSPWNTATVSVYFHRQAK